MRRGRRIGLWLAVALAVMVSASAAMAQPRLAVTLTVLTGRDGTEDVPILILKTVDGTIVASQALNQPGDLQPGMTNTYTFDVGANFCDITQFELDKPAGRAGDDVWDLTQFHLTIDGTPVWMSTSYDSPITATGTRGGTWQATQDYRDRCGALAWTLVELTLVTGDNGTRDNLLFELHGSFPDSPYTQVLDQPGDLQPGNTDGYVFIVPMEFCEMTGFRIIKPADGDAEDDWGLQEIYLTIDGQSVFFDRAAGTFAPVTTGSVPPNGNWSGTAAYINRCAATPTPVAAGMIVTLDSGQIQPVPLVTVQAIPLANNGLVIAAPPAPVVTCPGFMPSRLVAGKAGRVTPGDPNNLRAQPSTSSQLLGQIPAGGTFLVLSGPVCEASGIAYWQVNYNGVVGYTGEGQGNQYWTEPLP